LQRMNQSQEPFPKETRKVASRAKRPPSNWRDSFAGWGYLLLGQLKATGTSK
jgi:hypothetical protein